MTTKQTEARTLANEEAALAVAREILLRRIKEPGPGLTSPRAVTEYLTMQLGARESEQFWCLWCDSQNRLLAAEEMFRGTLTQTSVYPREVVRAAIAHNAACVIFAHNHPSGVAEPSRADELLTQNLKEALKLVECKVLDHFIVAGTRTISFAERGLL